MPGAPLTASTSRTVTLPDGREILSFGGCNYLALANHPIVIEAIREATGNFGVSSSASRETTGNTAAHERLERELAAFLGVEAALLVPDGYIANIAACQALAGTVVGGLLDARAHVSLSDALRAAGIPASTFAHLDAADLARARADLPAGDACVLTDGVFTADGDPAPIGQLAQALFPGDWLLIDDCHGLGVSGPGGRGSAAAAGISGPRIVITSSLAKGLGCAGGVIAGTSEFIDRCLASTAYLCTTPIAPALAEGTRAALAVLREEPDRVERLHSNAHRLRSNLHSLGLCRAPGKDATPIVAFTPGTEDQMRASALALLEQGFRVPLISYPGGPGAAYFRVSVNAAHTAEDIDALSQALSEALSDALREALSKDRTRAAATTAPALAD